MSNPWKNGVVILAGLVLGMGCGSGSNGSGQTKADTSAPQEDLRSAPDHVTADLHTSDSVASDTATDTSPDVAEDPGVTTPIPDQAWQVTPERKPRAIHVTWTDDASLTASIQWNIDGAGLDGYQAKLWIVPASQATLASDGKSRVLPFENAAVVPGQCTEYQEELLGVAMNEDIHVNCLVRVVGLQPGTEYLYRVGTWDSYDAKTLLFAKPELSDVQRFKSAPLPGSREKFTFIAAGDSRDGADLIAANMAPMAARNVDFWLFNGDFCEMGLQSEWNAWFDAMAPALSASPIMPVVGNHELVISTYASQFDLPIVAEIPEVLKERAWSFDYANVHFLAIDTNTTDNILGEKEWIEADLTQADANPNVDFTIVMQHHAVYSSSNHGTVERVKEELVPIYERHKVAMVYNGHDHMYERTFPVREDKINEEDGIIYVVAGAFFAPPYSAGTSWWTAVSADGDRGNYLVVEVDGTTIKGTGYYGDNLGTIDEFVIEYKK